MRACWHLVQVKDFFKSLQLVGRLLEVFILGAMFLFVNSYIFDIVQKFKFQFLLFSNQPVNKNLTIFPREFNYFTDKFFCVR